MDYIHFENHILVHEVCQRFLIRHNSPDLSRCKEHILGTFLSKELLHLVLTGKVQFLVRTGNDIGVALPLQFSYYRRPHHSTMPSHVYLAILFH